MIESLEILKNELDILFYGIERDCAVCEYPDCMGYTWLLKEEVGELRELGVPLVQINSGPIFIHSFPTTQDGKIDVTVRYPTCSQLCSKSRSCKIHSKRPMVCHLYPIGLETKLCGTIVWALHSDCLYVSRLKDNQLFADFEKKSLQLLSTISPSLKEKIVNTYLEVDSICTFPDGQNLFTTLAEVYHV